MRTGKNNKNQGFSIVELVVVIAIMALVTAGVGISVSSLNGSKVKKCADELVSAMESARVMTLGKEQNAVEAILYQEADGGIRVKTLRNNTVIAERELGESPIEIKVYFDNEATSYGLADIAGNSPTGNTEAGLHIMFNRSSGAFVEKTNKAGGAEKDYCTKVEVTGQGRTIEINMVGKTGKIVR